MISIKYSQIPDYLHNSSFFQALSVEEDDGEIQIPEQCFSRDGQVNTTDDFARLLRVADFWGLSLIPTGLIEFCIDSRTSRLSHLRRIIDAEFSTISFAQALRSIFMPDPSDTPDYPLVRAIALKRPEVVGHLAHSKDCGLQATAAAARQGHLATLQLLHQHGHLWDKSVCFLAAAGGHLKCLQFLHMNGCPWDEDASAITALRGHSDCLKYLHENGCPWDDKIVSLAAEGGHLNCLKYAHEQGLPWGELTTRILCNNGNLEVLQYAIENGCSFDSHAAFAAAANGHVDCLTYLHDIGCAIHGSYIAEMAFEKGHLGCVKMLVEWAYSRIECFSIEDAARFGHLHIVQFLREHGFSWGERDTLMAAKHGHFEVLTYLIEEGCECTLETVFESASSISESGIQCLKFLLERPDVPAVNNGELLMVAFLHGNYLAIEYILTKDSCGTVLSHTQRAKFRNSLNSWKTYCSDVNLSKCLECSLQHGWEAAADAVAYFTDKKESFPLCAAVAKAKKRKLRCV